MNQAEGGSSGTYGGISGGVRSGGTGGGAGSAYGNRPRGAGAASGRVLPALPAAVVALAAALLGTGVVRALGTRHGLFPGGVDGWSLAVLTGLIVGHLVALGRDRWWGGTGSGAALTLAVLLLYGWLPAVLVGLTVVVLVGLARRHRWRRGVLHGAVDILGTVAGALALAACGVTPSVEQPWHPERWDLYTVPELLLTGLAYLLVTRVLLWLLNTPGPRACPPRRVPR